MISNYFEGFFIEGINKLVGFPHGHVLKGEMNALTQAFLILQAAPTVNKR